MVSRLRWLKALCAAVGVLVLAGCAHIPGGIAPSNTPLEGRKYNILGDGKGKDSYVVLFGFLPIKGSNSIRVAIERAIADQSGGDALIDVTVEHYTFNILFYYRHCTLVEGRVIRFLPGSEVPGR